MINIMSGQTSQYIVKLRYVDEEGFEKRETQNVFVPYSEKENEKDLHERAEEMVVEDLKKRNVRLLKIYSVVYV